MEIKSCPFCGRNVRVNIINTPLGFIHVIECGGKDCFASMEKSSKEKLIDAWNKRTYKSERYAVSSE